jgi:hypothetical protein
MDRESSGGLELTFLYQKRGAIEAVRQSTNPDALSAALACADLAVGAALCSRRERGETYIEDETGRWRGDSFNPAAARGEEYARVLTQVATAERARWGELQALLPAAFTDDERDAILARDRELEAEGAFSVYQILRDSPTHDWDEDPGSYIVHLRTDSLEDDDG